MDKGVERTFENKYLSNQLDQQIVLCEYGCGYEAKYFFRYAKKWCCSKSKNSCPSLRKKNSENNMRRKISEETRRKLSRSHIGKLDSNETKKKKSLARIGKKNPMYGKLHPNRYTSHIIKEKFQFFSKIEEIRDNIITGRIEVRCKLNTCRKWFIPTYDQLRARIYALENKNGNDGLFFYCSEECKKQCPSYNIKPCRLIKYEYPYTGQQYQVFRQHVLNRDTFVCQYCGKAATDVHHERPQKLEPFFSLDPDYAWSCCKECHNKYGHSDECSVRKIGLKECNG